MAPLAATHSAGTSYPWLSWRMGVWAALRLWGAWWGLSAGSRWLSCGSPYRSSYIGPGGVVGKLVLLLFWDDITIAVLYNTLSNPTFSSLLTYTYKHTVAKNLHTSTLAMFLYTHRHSLFFPSALVLKLSQHQCNKVYCMPQYFSQQLCFSLFHTQCTNNFFFPPTAHTHYANKHFW